MTLVKNGSWLDQTNITLEEKEKLRIFHGEPKDILPRLKSDSIEIYFTEHGPIPEDICEELYRLLGEDKDVYLDVCMGEGERAITTLQESKRYIGIEPDDEKWKKACERIREYVNPKPKKIETKKGTPFAHLFPAPKSS